MKQNHLKFDPDNQITFTRRQIAISLFSMHSLVFHPDPVKRMTPSFEQTKIMTNEHRNGQEVNTCLYFNEGAHEQINMTFYFS